MSFSDKNKRVLEEPISFRGTVGFESHTHDVDFEIFTDEAHNVWMRFKNGDESLSRFLEMGSYGSPGESIKTLSVIGSTSDGKVFSSEVR